MMAALRKNGFQLADLLVDQDCAQQTFSFDCLISGLALDSRQLEQGDLFLACLGEHDAGEHYIDQAIEKGAAAVLRELTASDNTQEVEYRISKEGRRVPIIDIANLTKQVGLIADRFYQHPSQHMYVTGITGTNGKTSCCHYIAHVLSKNVRCGVIGTLGYGLYGDLKTGQYTTPDAVTCHKAMAGMRDDGAAHAVMEVSSHALAQARVNGIAFDCAVFTNLTREHLDYHGDMQSYGEVKRSLFSWPTLKSAVINVDDAFANELQKNLPSHVKMLGYGLQSQQAQVKGYDLELDTHGLKMHVSTPWGGGELRTHLLGYFNASNLLAALSVLLLQEIPFEAALQRLAQVPALPGRMQYFTKQGLAMIVVDYAHTPDALKQVLKALRTHCHGALWCVFGCGGERDRGKRKPMGQIAAQYADRVILTNDNPRHEEPTEIIQHIQQGLDDPNVVEVVLDRGEAITFAISKANANDVVLIAGKGHETYQQVGDIRRPFSDAMAVRHALGIPNHAK